MTRDFNSRIRWWQALLVLLVPLVILFHPSLRSEMVLFSNDGPLGIISSDAGALPGAFAGYWDDLNWVGKENPSALPDFSMFLGLLVGSSVTYSKIYAPVSLLFLGMAGWFLFRRMGFHPFVCLLGALAFALNMNAFSNACWGLPSRATTLASIVLALGCLHLRPRRFGFLKYVLAGFGVGHAIMEGFDVGALYSIAVGFYTAFLVLQEKGDIGQKGLKAVGLVAVVAVAAAVFSAQALSTLIGTQVRGVAEMNQDERAREQRWQEATQWSLPPSELLRVAVPGMFGYRMTDMGGKVEESSYWGAVGRTEGWEQHKQGLPRHSGSGEYAGILVLLLAAFAVFQSFRGAGGALPVRSRRAVWFWAAVAVVSALLALGKHGPLYRMVYELPYVSMIRNPIKFMHLVHLAVTILFGYGLHTLWVGAFNSGKDRQQDFKAYLKQWWAGVSGFDRKWTLGCGICGFAGVLLWLIYASSASEMTRVLTAGAMPSDLAAAIHAFSAKEVLTSVGFFLCGWVWITLLLSGAVRRSQATLMGTILVCLVLVDLGRSNRFWIIYYDYKEKYATNPVIETLREKSYEGRVTSTLNPFAPTSLSNENGSFFNVIANSWLQHQFPYYNIQSLDVVQMPRPQAMDVNFGARFVPTTREEGSRYSRLWELTSTRYLLGMTGYVAVLNREFDHSRDRFEILSRFNFAPKSNQPGNAVSVDDLTATTNPAGSFGIIEFKGALPKAKLYARWEVIEEEAEALNRLGDLQFDPSQSVVVMDGSVPAADPGAAGGEVGQATITNYRPKRIEVETEAAGDRVLLFNDRYHPHWNVYVDGEPRPLLRCNYLMRGVVLGPGKHTVSFRYEPDQTGLMISVASLCVGLGICLILRPGRDEEKAPTDATPSEADSKPQVTPSKSETT